MHAVCNLLFRLFGHRICCGNIPGWTAGVGFGPWQSIDVKPWNLYNVIWRVQNMIRQA